MKKNIDKNKLKILIPLGLFFAISASTTGFFLSPMGKAVVQPQALQAGYDQIANMPVHQNRYRPEDNQDFNTSGLKIVSQPDFNKDQSWDFTSDEYKVTTKNYTTQVPVASVTNSKPSNAPVLEQTVWAMKMSKQQFEKMFKMKQEPQIGLKFDVQFSVWNESAKKNETVTFNNSITGFDLGDLINLKKKSYLVFNHNINDDFSAYLGRLTANLNVSIDILGNYYMSLDVQAYGLVTNQLSSDATKNVFTIDFSPSQIAPSVLTLWNVNGLNDLSQYFWKPPMGPVVNPEIVLPQIDSRVISNKQYSAKHKGFANTRSPSFNLPYSKVNNVSATNGTNTDINDIYVINMTQAQWQHELYTQYANQKGSAPANPGLKVQFNFKLSLIGAEYGEVQEYNPTLYGYVQMSDLTRGRSLSQNISDYDLSAGRNNNLGRIKVDLRATINLDSSLTIKLSVRGQNLGYFQSKTANSALKASDYKAWFDLTNLSLASYYNQKGNSTNIGQVLPNTNFSTDLSQANYSTQINNVNVKNEYPTRRSPGRTRNHKVGGGYLFLSSAIYSNQGTMNLGSYVENNSAYAKKSALTFNFGGLAKFDNAMRIKNQITRNVGQTIYFDQGWQNPKSKYPLQTTSGTNITNTQDQGNRFKIYVSQISTSETVYVWKKMYTYFVGGEKFPKQWEPTLAFDDNWQFKSSLMRMRFQLVLRKSSDNLTIYYKLGVSAASYQWEWASNFLNGYAWVNGPQQGSGGFKLNSVDLKVNV